MVSLRGRVAVHRMDFRSVGSRRGRQQFIASLAGSFLLHLSRTRAMRACIKHLLFAVAAPGLPMWLVPIRVLRDFEAAQFFELLLRHTRYYRRSGFGGWLGSTRCARYETWHE